MAVELNSFVWASAGIEPTNEEDAIYTAGDQPIAGYDNFIMWAITSDIHSLEAYTTSHGHDHEAGGTQQINLDGLSIGSSTTLVDDTGNLKLNDSGGVTFVDIDVDSDLIREFPVFSQTVDSRGGFATGNDITRRDGDVIYDHAEDRFHRADHAVNADNATQADNAANLGGDPPGAYIQPDDATRTITGEWEYTKTVNTDIDGNATTANHADEADHATNADLAADSNALEGAGRSAFTEHASDEDITGSWGFLSSIHHVNTGNFERFSAVDVDDELTFRNGNNRFEFVPSPSGVLQSGDYFGYDFQQNYWNFGEAVYVNNEEVAVQSDVTNVENQLFDTSADYTITGNWTYDNLIDGTITNAQWADNADHANTADHATEADHATNADFATLAEEANDSDRVDGYHAQEIVDMATGSVDQSNIDVADNGVTEVSNASTLSFDDNVDVVESSSGVAGVSVTSVDHATNAEYATNSDQVDGYHAQDLIDMMGGGDGRWTFLDVAEYSHGNGWVWDFDPNQNYDQYRIAIVHEAHGSGMNRLWLTMNHDTRNRYFYFKHNRFSDGYKLVDEDNTFFPVCLTYDGETAYGEYVLTKMPSIDGGLDNYPGISRMEYVAHPRASGGTLDYGYLETNYSEIDSVQIEGRYDSAAYIAVWGKNFPSI